jgi:hypothetical protein
LVASLRRLQNALIKCPLLAQSGALGQKQTYARNKPCPLYTQ